MKVTMLFSLVLAAGLSAAAASDVSTKSPVERIVKLLTTVKETTIADGKHEQQIYDKYACWCETTSKRKADDIVQAQEDLRALGQSILKLKGTVAIRTAEIADLTAKIEANEKEQEELTAIRQKQNGEWAEESEEVKQALAALQSAIKVLAEATTPGKGGEFIQEDMLLRTKYAVQTVLAKLPSKISLPPARMALLSEFTSAKSGYAPQSATIQGMLGDMYLTFSTNLESATLEEANQNHDYEDMYAILEKDNNKKKATRARKETEKADAEQMLADTTKTFEDTEKQMEADKVFFDEVKAACQSKHKEWTVRVDMREQELDGINKALEILTGDEARELFAKAIKPGVETFLQVASTPSLLQSSVHAASTRAYDAIKTQVKKSHSVRLAALAVQVRTAKVGHFDEVIKAIDDMLETLQKEGAADIEKRDQCKDEYKEIASTVNDLDWKIKNNEAKIAKLEKLIEKRQQEKADAIQKKKETLQYIDDITKEREDEHDAYIAAKKDDEAAIKLLTAAQDVMAKFYKKNGVEMGPIQGSAKAALVQEPVFERSQDDAPDATFSDKGNNKLASKNILQLFAYIIEDLNDELSNEKKSEEKSQADFEEEKATAEKAVENLETKITNLKDRIQKRGEDKDDENTDKDNNNDDRTEELNYQAKIKPDCDWILKAFTQRAEARAAEADGLTTAKEFLAGQTALLQKGTGKFDDSKLKSIHFLGISN